MNCRKSGKAVEKVENEDSRDEKNNLNNQIEKVLGEVMKQLYYVVAVFVLISLPFLGAFFFHNYTATAIGLVISPPHCWYYILL